MILVRILRYGFHLLYHQLAWTYDSVAALVSAGHWIEWVRSIAPDLEGCSRILEIGHGPGHLLESLAGPGRQLIGIDLSPQMGQRARKKLRPLNPQPGLVQADARALPFPDGTFDAVVATFPAEYIAEPETWRSFRRMIDARGRIVVLLGARPGGWHPLNLLSKALFAITNRIGEADVLRARTRFLEETDRLDLSFTRISRRAGNAETYLLIAVPAEAGPASSLNTDRDPGV